MKRSLFNTPRKLCLRNVLAIGRLKTVTFNNMKQSDFIIQYNREKREKQMGEFLVLLVILALVLLMLVVSIFRAS